MIKNIEQVQTDLQAIAERMLQRAKAKGATDASVCAAEGDGLDVNVRFGEVETIEHNQGRSFDITVYQGKRKGYASTSDTSDSSIDHAIEAALSIAEYTEEDECSGLPDAENLATDFKDLSLYHPTEVSVDEAIERAKECEDIALDVDDRINNSEGASFGSYSTVRVYGNSHGFMGAYPSSRFSLDCSVIAELKGEMQRDYGYSVSRDINDLWTAERVAKEAAERTVEKLGSQKMKTGTYPVLFRADVARSLIGHFLSAISGGAQYRHQTFMKDSIGQPYFPEWMNVVDDPFVLKGFGSCAFDGEGVKVQKRNLLESGVVQGYLLNSYSARKLKMPVTGNSGGSHNVFVTTQDKSLDDLLTEMDTGLFVTDVMGDGVSIITGDYSRGVNGFWVEGGKIQYPVEEITVASNLRDIFKGIVAVGNDIDLRSALSVGSILINQMTVAGG